MSSPDSSEVENARLLVEQTWLKFEPAYEAMWRYFAACAFRSWQEDRPLPPSELVRCDACEKPMYRRAVDRWAVISLTEEEGLLGCTPITIVINRRQQITTCSVRCLKLMIVSMPDSDFCSGGYPL